jgi:RNA polymerase sigma-70 factor (ECF subfamily)
MLASDALFAEERPRLIGLAYRLLGSLADAEDIVQEAWVRWNRVDHAALDSPQAFLTTVVSRLGIDRLRARQRAQVDYVGPWLPEPLVSAEDGPAAAAELGDSLTTAFLVLLERLSPEERLVLLLADVFGQSFANVAAVVGKSPDATRQIAVRARRKVRTDEDAVPPRAGREQQLLVAAEFVAAVAAGDEARVRALVTADGVLVSDGGAKRHAARRPVVGAERIARFLVNIFRRFAAIEGHEVTARSCWINGSPGVVLSIDAMPYWVVAFDVRDGRVDRLHATLNPDKLGAVDRIIDLV